MTHKRPAILAIVRIFEDKKRQVDSEVLELLNRGNRPTIRTNDAFLNQRSLSNCPIKNLDKYLANVHDPRARNPNEGNPTLYSRCCLQEWSCIALSDNAWYPPLMLSAPSPKKNLRSSNGRCSSTFMNSHLVSLHHNNKAVSASHPSDPLRGCSLSSILCNRSLLRSSDDSIAAHAISAPVDYLDIFLSHAWCDSGLWKQIALLLCCSPSIAHQIVVTVTLVGVLFKRQHFYRPLYITVISLFCVVTFVAFTIVFSLYKHRNTMVFLDKCCINQTDLAAKARGISRLSDYLRKSDKLIILWTPNYLDRLWCVYELAVFMRTHDKKDVIVLNLGHVKLCLSLLVFQLLDTVAHCLAVLEVHRESNIFMLCNVCSTIITFILVGCQAYRCSEEWATFSSRVQSFNVSNTKCKSREDYNKLTRLIREMYGSEANFAAVVKRLCVGEEKDERASMWFLSRTSLRIMSTPFVPSIAKGFASVLFFIFTESYKPMAKIASTGSAPETPSNLATFSWAIRTRLLPALIRSIYVPLLLFLAHKLASRESRPRSHLLIGILYTSAFILLAWLSQFTCSIGRTHYPFFIESVRGSWYETSLLLAGLIEFCIIWALSRRVFSNRLSGVLS